MKIGIAQLRKNRKRNFCGIAIIRISVLFAWILLLTWMPQTAKAETKIHDPGVIALSSIVLSIVLGTIVGAALTPEDDIKNEINTHPKQGQSLQDRDKITGFNISTDLMRF